MSTRYRLTRPPAPLRRVHHDNLAVVPGNLLPYRTAWQRVANRLPSGGVLIILPQDNPTQKHALLAVAKLLAAEGHQVSVQPAEEFERHHDHDHPDLDPA